MKVIINRHWSFEDTIKAAFEAYIGSGITSRGYRNSVLMEWGTIVGREQALLGLDEFTTKHGGKSGAAEYLGVATSSLFKIRNHYLSLPPELIAGTTNVLPTDHSEFRVVDPNEVYIAEGRERNIILGLLDREGEGFWDAIDDLRPGLIETIARAKTYESRLNAVREFEAHLAAHNWSEGEWEGFFRSNKWIFGHGLDYRFLGEVQGQPHYGGVTVTGSGGQRGDFLMATAAVARFTVLVEIKKPDSELVTKNTYRNGVHELGKELTGGVSQLQSYCRRWVLEGSRQETNVEMLMAENITTAEPKGFLIIGQTAQLDDTAKKLTFELFRRNLHNPEVITYDELLARARFVVSVPESGGDDPVPPAAASLEEDDTPF